MTVAIATPHDANAGRCLQHRRLRLRHREWRGGVLDAIRFAMARRLLTPEDLKSRSRTARTAMPMGFTDDIAGWPSSITTTTPSTTVQYGHRDRGGEGL